MTNIIRAVFNCNEYNTTAARPDGKPIYQYNYGQILQIHGLDLQKAVEIHFSHSMITGDAIIRIGTTTDKITEVAVPEKFLETSGTVTVYIYVSDTESGQTEYKIQFQIAARAKPEAWDSPEDAELFRETIVQVNAAADRAEDGATRAETASTIAQTAQTAAESARDTAITARDNAAEAAQTATVQADRAEVEADKAETSQADAAVSKDTAQQALTDLLHVLGTDVATLTDGKLTPSQIPPISVNDVFEVADVSDLTGLTAERGDVGIVVSGGVVTDSYILAADNPGNLDDWKKLGVSYVANAGHAVTADNATNADRINGKRIIAMTQEQYDAGALDPDTLYVVTPEV